MAPGAIAGVGDWRSPGDSPDVHFDDTVKGGSFMNEQRLVRLLVEESPSLIVEMEHVGALWQREEDGTAYSLRTDGGHSFPRCAFQEDRTGREMLRALMGELKRRNVTILPDVMVLRVLTSGGEAAGAVGLDLQNCDPVFVRAKAVILACGGAGNVYLNTTNPAGATGDGYALALEAGAAVMDMEFVQFFPLGFLFPPSLRGALGAQLYFAHLRNNKGERFMERYDPERLEASTRDRIAIACSTEIREGRGGPRGGVFADMTYHEPGAFARAQPIFYETYRKIGIDPEKNYVEVAPTCHFFMGGVMVDENWQSAVPGLFAAGESAAGMHGANRLSQNSLAELLVSGSHAGRSAAHRALRAPLLRIDPSEAHVVEAWADRLLKGGGGPRPVVLRNRLRRLMWERAGVFRTGLELQSLLDDLAGIRAELDRQTLSSGTRRYNRELNEALENFFLTTTAECVAKAALARTESRGAHYRDDCRVTDNGKWLRHILVRLDDGKYELSQVPVDLRETRPSEQGV
jgi:succinate dehydrogenase/fumarate reductase flavoprotein subunit